MSWQYWNSFTYLVCLGFLILRYRGEPTNGIRSKLSFICRATYLTVMSKNVLQCWSQVRRELERVCQCPGGLRALPHDAQPNPSRPIGVFKKTFRIRKSWWSAPRTPWAPFIPTWRVPTHNVRQPTCRAHSATPSKPSPSSPSPRLPPCRTSLSRSIQKVCWRMLLHSAADGILPTTAPTFSRSHASEALLAGAPSRLCPDFGTDSPWSSGQPVAK